MSEMVIKRLRRYNHPHYYHHLNYKGAGHNIGVPYGITTATSYRHPVSGVVYALGGNARDNAFARSDSWPRVLTFLDQSIKRNAGHKTEVR